MSGVFYLIAKFGACTRGAVTVDFVALMALVLIVTIGFSTPIVDGISALAEVIRDKLFLHPVHTPETW